jgi:hypothetical protein
VSCPCSDFSDRIKLRSLKKLGSKEDCANGCDFTYLGTLIVNKGLQYLKNNHSSSNEKKFRLISTSWCFIPVVFQVISYH